MKLKENILNMKPYKAGIKIEGKEKLSSNENPLGTSPLAMEAIRSLLDFSVYPDPASGNLRKRIAEKYGLKPDNVITGNGSDEVLTWTAACLIGENDNAITASSTFSEYTFSVELLAGKMKKAPLNNGCFDPQEILKLIDDHTKIIYLCNPNNPTGTYLPGTVLTELLDNIPSEVLVVIDEAYGEYVEAEDFISGITLLERYPNIMVLKTFSKIYGLAALRAGYALASEKIIDGLWRTKQPFNMNAAAQAGAEAALLDTDFVNRSLKITREGKKYLYTQLDLMGLEYYPTESNFICINVKTHSEEVFHSIMEQGMTIRSLCSFGMDNFIRFTIGTQEQNERFISYLKKALK